MPFVPVANTVLVELRMTQDGQQVENTLYFTRPDAVTPANMLTLAADVRSWWEAEYSTQASTSVELREVVVTDLTSATGPQVSDVPPVPAFGDLTSEFLPGNVSLAVSFRTANRGRSFRGRNYFVGLTDDQVTGNTVNGGTTAAIVDIYEALLPPFGGSGGYAWSVVSRFSGVDANGVPIPRVAGVSTPIISVSVVDGIVDSQRRRLPSRGR